MTSRANFPATAAHPLEHEPLSTIGDIVSRDIRTAKVFRKYGIDYCCGGQRTIGEVCEAKNIDPRELSFQLLIPGNARHAGVLSIDQWELDFLSTYIVNIHHAYVRNTMPMLLSWSGKVAEAHGGAHPEVREIAKLVTMMCGEMAKHMQTEENVLFPYIAEMAQASRKTGADLDMSLGFVGSPLRVMEDDHELVGNIFMEIERLSANFTPPADACNTFKAFYVSLEEFEDDLFLHVHLENNILFPKAERLERELRSRQCMF